jgi:hypothetical protein
MLDRWKPGERAYIDAGAERQPRGRIFRVRTGVTSRLHSLAAGAVALALLVAPNTERADCGNAADRYTAAVAQVINALRGYEKCVSSSNRGDDCAAEIQALDNAHDDFADAVADAKICQ